MCECISTFLARTDWAAIATIVIAIFTCCLWYSTDKLWKATKESIKLGSDEIILSHPPKLRVHSVSFDLGVRSLPSQGISGRGSEIQCRINNIGGSDAEITESTFGIKEFEILPQVLPYGENYLTPERTIAPGGHTIGKVSPDELIEDSLINNRYDKKIYFFGYIDYLDKIGTRRRAAFCRKYNPITGRFTAVEDDDYEYSY